MRARTFGILLLALWIGVCFLLTGEARQSANFATEKNSQPDTQYSEIRKAPEKARAKRNPLEKDPDAAAAGRILFQQRCAECHGDNAEGGEKGPSLRAAEIQNAEPGAIFWILTNGVVRKGMPVWSKLPEPQRWQLVSFIKSLGPTPVRTEAPPANASLPPAKDSTSGLR
jgi:mono/diheme cytochrome c family protein